MGSIPFTEATVDVPTFIFHIDLLLVALATAFILSTLPRLFAAVRQPSHFFTGYFMRGPGDAEVPSFAREYAGPSDNSDPDANIDMAESVRDAGQTEDSHRFDAHAHTPTLPTPVPSWITLTHPIIVSLATYDILPGVTFSRGIVILTITGVLAYAGFYESNPFSDPVREGYLAMAIFPLVVVVACKNNVLTWLAGVGYERLNWLHRALGTFLVLCANIHGIGNIYKFANNGIFYTMLKRPQFRYAFVALASVDLLYLGSRQFVRSKSYTLFLLSHFFGLVAAAIGMTHHFSVTIPYVVAGVIVYALDRVLRLARTRITTVHLTPIPHLNSGTTHVHMPRLTRGYRAGQHVRVRIVDGTGPLAWIRALALSRPRPFTLASRPSGSGAELYIKRERGPFTTSLNKMAGDERTSPKSEKEEGLSDIEVSQPTRKVRMLVEGPYGGPSYTVFESYSCVVLVAGGSGISFALGMLDNLTEAHAAGRSRVHAIEVVWVIADPAALTALLPVLRSLLRPRSAPRNVLAIRMSVHYTRAGGGPLPDLSRLPSGAHLCAGRPNLSRTLDAAIDRVRDARAGSAPGGSSGIVAAACGPHELVAQLEGAVGSLSWERWRDAGGVEIVSEAFAF